MKASTQDSVVEKGVVTSCSMRIMFRQVIIVMCTFLEAAERRAERRGFDVRFGVWIVMEVFACERRVRRKVFWGVFGGGGV